MEERTPGAVYRWEMRHVAVPRDAEGWAPLWISAAFLHPAQVIAGRMHIGDCAFSGLLIDVEWLDGEALAEVVRLAEAGLMVIIRRAPRPPGRRSRGDYRDLLESLRALPNVVDRLGASGLRPLITGEDIPPYWARRTAEALYVFFAHPKARELRYPMRYGQSLCCERAIRRVTIDHETESFPVDLIFEPYQSLLLRVSVAEGVQFVDIGYRPPEPICLE